MSASSLEVVTAARGGLEGGASPKPVLTSGKPLCPAGAGSVMKASQMSRRVNDIAAGEDVDRSAGLAFAITTGGHVCFIVRHN